MMIGGRGEFRSKFLIPMTYATELEKGSSWQTAATRGLPTVLETLTRAASILGRSSIPTLAFELTI
jgi:hypothetical protein